MNKYDEQFLNEFSQELSFTFKIKITTAKALLVMNKNNRTYKETKDVVETFFKIMQ